MKRASYSNSIANFRAASQNEILGALSQGSELADEPTQKAAWLEEAIILKEVLSHFEGRIYFEYSIPRMGKYIDVVLLIGPVIFVLEFKVGEKHFTLSALDQVCDYALDLKNFHDSSYNHFIAPVLIPTEARHVTPVVCATPQGDKLLSPIRCSVALLGEVIEAVLRSAEGDKDIDPEVWESGRYCPTPTIIEAALALYKKH